MSMTVLHACISLSSKECSICGRRSTYTVLVGKSEGKRPLGRPPHRWKDNIKMDFQEMGWGNGPD